MDASRHDPLQRMNSAPPPALWFAQDAPTKKPAAAPAAPRAPRSRKDPAQDRKAAWFSHVLPPARPEEEHFRHGHWRAKRHRVRAALVSVHTPEAALNRWDSCGSECSVEWNAGKKEARLRANYCRSRHCEPCAAAKAGRMARNLRSKLDEAKAGTVRFVTLTLKHNDAPLADQLKRLYAAFKSLRKSPCWRRTQKGGAVILEVKHNGRDWHPHLHVLTEGTFLDHRDLSAAWLHVTTDSSVVDIRALSNHADAAHYLSKYVTKGTTGNVWMNVDLAQEWITATKGVRTANAFGSWRGFRLLEPPEQEEGWLPLMPLHVLIQKANAGDLGAQGILHSLRPPGKSTDLHLDGHYDTT